MTRLMAKGRHRFFGYSLNAAKNTGSKSAAERELRHVSRADLIEIIYELQQAELELKQENAALKEQLQQRRVAIESSGTLAEALAKINGLFDAAQATANDYVAAAKRQSAEAKAQLDEAKRARKQADDYLASARRQASEVVISQPSVVQQPAARQASQQAAPIRRASHARGL